MSRAKEDLVFKALADRRRRAMLDFLKDQPRNTGELCDRFQQLDRCTVMQHLRVLEEAGLIIAKKEGRLRWNFLNVVPIQEIYERWISSYARPSAALLTQMKRDMDSN